jgi:hypothetical protein
MPASECADPGVESSVFSRRGSRLPRCDDLGPDRYIGPATFDRSIRPSYTWHLPRLKAGYVSQSCHGWVGKPIREALPDVAGHEFFELLDKVYLSGQTDKVVRVPARFRVAGSQVEEVRVLDFVYAPYFDSAGAVAGVFCQGFDIAHRLQAERELRERDEQLRLAVEAGEVGLWDLDLDNDRLFWPARVKDWSPLTGGRCSGPLPNHRASAVSTGIDLRLQLAATCAIR